MDKRHNIPEIARHDVRVDTEQAEAARGGFQGEVRQTGGTLGVGFSWADVAHDIHCAGELAGRKAG